MNTIKEYFEKKAREKAERKVLFERERIRYECGHPETDYYYNKIVWCAHCGDIVSTEAFDKDKIEIKAVTK